MVKTNIFIENLKYLREKKELSQEKLGKLAGINQTTIARWENGKVAPTLDNIYDLANALGIQIADLFDKNLKNEKIQNSTELLFDKAKDILSADDRDTIEFIMKKAIAKYEKNKKDNQ